MVTREQVLEAMKSVIDPEIRLGIVDLGLVYGVDLDEEKSSVSVRMTLTTPMCPYGPMLVSQVQDVLSCLPGVQEGRVVLVWDPPWNPREMATDEVKDALNLW